MTDYAGGWDTGAIYGAKTYPGDQPDDSNQVIEQKFFDFVRNFTVNNVYIYRYYPAF